MERMKTTPQRKYRMIRLSAGDYLLPGNDGETIFRIAKYVEDGSLEHYDGDDGRTITGEFWAAWRWPKPKATLRASYDHDPFDEWELWYMVEDLFETRQQAIDAALEWEWNRDHPMHDQPRRKPMDVSTIYGLFSRSATAETGNPGRADGENDGDQG